MTAPKYLQNHPMFSQDDYEYLRRIGYTNREIKALWDRDHANGAEPVNHPQIFDIVGYLNQ